ncbi:hypothetical protein AD006_03945 [Pseudonocardia sp. EC080610-09]|uniref:hypothetical protein n=1 Tax=unclassified Pseudonocardia TaxID=2619320 RepID=UPI0006CB28F7|nr:MULTISPECIES: hypothetical protein [unclassified Pseudonocardia]ALE75323.1 hypothetical protein FRP1_24760 [Pseudonocardia sp. EC080625-04]ALL74685.1 hypothetical protein AD006_03945 [Pseudonocardia sp. EC080610-09]ALL81707.1 hypothetical protein AD017_11765 [Pseudonocardia sp. EC080619-01]
MKNRMRRTLVAVGALGAVAFPLAGFAAADTGDDEHGYPSTQSPTQGVDAVGATADTAAYGLFDALDGFSSSNRPDGVNGTDTEFPQADPRFVEGPVGGLLVNGPFE